MNLTRDDFVTDAGRLVRSANVRYCCMSGDLALLINTTRAMCYAVDPDTGHAELCGRVALDGGFDRLALVADEVWLRSAEGAWYGLPTESLRAGDGDVTPPDWQPIDPAEVERVMTPPPDIGEPG